MALNIVQNLFMICHGQDLQLFTSNICWVLNIPFVIVHPFVFHSEFHNHLQDNKNVLNRFHAQSAFQLFKHKVLYIIFMKFVTLTKLWQNVIFKNQHVGCQCRLFHIRSLVLSPCVRNFSNCLLNHNFEFNWF